MEFKPSQGCDSGDSDQLSLTLCILMDIPRTIYTISFVLPILYFKGSQVKVFLNYGVFLSLNLANSADSNEMQHDATFHLDLQATKVPQYVN